MNRIAVIPMVFDPPPPDIDHSNVVAGVLSIQTLQEAIARVEASSGQPIVFSPEPEPTWSAGVSSCG